MRSLVLAALAWSQAADAPFRRHELDAAGPKDPWVKILGDVNGDGKLDVLVGGRSGPLAAYLAPDWKKVVIAKDGYNSVDGEGGDLDGDGDVDVVLGGLVWFENPSPSTPLGASWKAHRIDAFNAHDVELGDLDRDGRLDVVARDQSGFGHRAGNKIHLYRNDAKGAWTRLVLECPHGEGLKVADLDRDGDLDVAIGARWYENPGKAFAAPWVEHVFASRWTQADVKVEVADVNGDGRPDIVLAPAEPAGGKYRLSWFEAPDWAEHVVADGVESVIHGLAAADFDGDGQVDLATSAMHQGADPDEVVLWINGGKGKAWRRRVLSDKGSHNIRAGDVGGDGDADLVGANWSGPDPAILLWENLGKASGMVRAHLHVSGRVQGVGFRASTEEEARRLGGVVGWVKNLADGRVEAVIQGPKDKVEALVKWCHKGPSSARVDKVEVTWESTLEDFENFRTRF